MPSPAPTPRAFPPGTLDAAAAQPGPASGGPVSGPTPGHRPGFTLIEVLFALAVFVIGFAALATLLPSGALMQREAQATVESRICMLNSGEVLKARGICPLYEEAAAGASRAGLASGDAPMPLANFKALAPGHALPTLLGTMDFNTWSINAAERGGAVFALGASCTGMRSPLHGSVQANRYLSLEEFATKYAISGGNAAQQESGFLGGHLSHYPSGGTHTLHPYLNTDNDRCLYWDAFSAYFANLNRTVPVAGSVLGYEDLGNPASGDNYWGGNPVLLTDGGDLSHWGMGRIHALMNRPLHGFTNGGVSELDLSYPSDLFDLGGRRFYTKAYFADPARNEDARLWKFQLVCLSRFSDERWPEKNANMPTWNSASVGLLTSDPSLLRNKHPDAFRNNHRALFYFSAFGGPLPTAAKWGGNAEWGARPLSPFRVEPDGLPCLFRVPAVIYSKYPSGNVGGDLVLVNYPPALCDPSVADFYAGAPVNSGDTQPDGSFRLSDYPGLAGGVDRRLKLGDSFLTTEGGVRLTVKRVVPISAGMPNIGGLINDPRYQLIEVTPSLSSTPLSDDPAANDWTLGSINYAPPSFNANASPWRASVTIESNSIMRPRNDFCN